MIFKWVEKGFLNSDFLSTDFLLFHRSREKSFLCRCFKVCVKFHCLFKAFEEIWLLLPKIFKLFTGSLGESHKRLRKSIKERDLWF